MHCVLTFCWIVHGFGLKKCRISHVLARTFYTLHSPHIHASHATHSKKTSEKIRGRSAGLDLRVVLRTHPVDQTGQFPQYDAFCELWKDNCVNIALECCWFLR